MPSLRSHRGGTVTGTRSCAMDTCGLGPSRPAEPLWHRAWLDAYPCDVPSSIPYPRVPVSTLMEMSAKRFPYRPACTIFGHSISFAKLNEQSRRFARSLAALRGWLYRVERLRRNGPFSLRENEHVHHYDHFRRGETSDPSPRIVPEEDVALMSPTGGTTGSPKVVMLTHRNLVANAFQLGAWSR